MHELAGFAPPTHHALVKRVRQGAQRILGITVENRKEPVTTPMLLQLVEKSAAAVARPVQVMLVTFLVFCFSGAFRYSDVARLKVDHLRFESDHVSVFVPKRKNDQFREADCVPIAKGSTSACPVGLLQRVIRESNLAPGDFVFRAFNGHRAVASGYHCAWLPNRHLSYTQARYHILKLLAGALGLSAQECCKLFGLHSGRSGCTTAAIRAGVPKELVVMHAGWKSDKSMQQYLKLHVDKRLEVSQALGL